MKARIHQVTPNQSRYSERAGASNGGSSQRDPKKMPVDESYDYVGTSNVSGIRSNNDTARLITPVSDMEQKLGRLFEIKNRSAQKAGFHKMTPFEADSRDMREVLRDMQFRDVFPKDERATRSVINLSNAIMPLLEGVNEVMHEEVNRAFADAVAHIKRYTGLLPLPDSLGASNTVCYIT